MRTKTITLRDYGLFQRLVKHQSKLRASTCRDCEKLAEQSRQHLASNSSSMEIRLALAEENTKLKKENKGLKKSLVEALKELGYSGEDLKII